MYLVSIIIIKFQGRHQQMARIEIAGIWNLRNWNWNWNLRNWNWNWNSLWVVELELELELKITELELELKKWNWPQPWIPVNSNKMRKFDMWTLPWQVLWQFPMHIITAQAVAVGCVWWSWWQFSIFQCRIASLWIIWLHGYRDMDRINIGIEMWYQYWYWYKKICNDMQP